MQGTPIGAWNKCGRRMFLFRMRRRCQVLSPHGLDMDARCCLADEACMAEMVSARQLDKRQVRRCVRSERVLMLAQQIKANDARRAAQ
jgi:hypothetical protein